MAILVAADFWHFGPKSAFLARSPILQVLVRKGVIELRSLEGGSKICHFCVPIFGPNFSENKKVVAIQIASPNGDLLNASSAL
jgi:hypothetical protein